MPTLSRTIRSAQTQDGQVLLDVLRGRVFCLNPVASKIIDLLVEGLPEPQIVAEITRIYRVDADTVRADLEEFLGRLHEQHVLEAERAIELDKPTQGTDCI
jgi:hypothetical protein